MRLLITDQETGEKITFESAECDVLIGSDPACDLVLDGDGVSEQHCRLIRASNHLFLKRKKDESGIVTAVYRNEMSEHGTHYHWDGDEERIDGRPFRIGRYTVCRY
jgi:hypothetical protein